MKPNVCTQNGSIAIDPVEGSSGSALFQKNSQEVKGAHSTHYELLFPCILDKHSFHKY